MTSPPPTAWPPQTSCSCVLQPGEDAAATTIPISTKDLQQLRVVAVANEVECKPDPANQILLMPPFCLAPG